MFGAAYFGKTYFGGTYFGPNILVTVVLRKKPYDDSVSGADEEYTVRKKKVRKDEYETEKERILAQIKQEDEEIIAIIISAVKSGIV